MRTFYNQMNMETLPETSSKKPIWVWFLLGFALVLTIVWLVLTPSGLLGKANAVGYAVCHQIEERSFKIGERTFPMCARCSGLFLGAMLGLTYQVIGGGRKGKMPPLPVMILFGLLALAWVLDGINSFLMMVPGFPSPYATQNWTRLVTGTGMGLAVSAILMPSYIQTMFRTWEDSSIFDSGWRVLILLLLAAGLDVLIWIEIPWLMYLLAIFSALGVLTLLTMVYSMVFVMITKKENTYEHVKQLFVPLVAGFTIALLQIGAIDLLRYLWTGTWGGFNLL